MCTVYRGGAKICRVTAVKTFLWGPAVVLSRIVRCPHCESGLWCFELGLRLALFLLARLGRMRGLCRSHHVHSVPLRRSRMLRAVVPRTAARALNAISHKTPERLAIWRMAAQQAGCECTDQIQILSIICRVVATGVLIESAFRWMFVNWHVFGVCGIL